MVSKEEKRKEYPISWAQQLTVDLNWELLESEFSRKFIELKHALKKHIIVINRAKRMVSSNLAMAAFYQ